jgi:cyclophilin family peptidyl-prolyl cis-trans isomerase
MTHAIARRWLPLMVIALIALIAVGCGQDEVTTGSATVAGVETNATTPAQVGAAPQSTATTGAVAANEGTSTTVSTSTPKQWSQPPAMQLEAGKDYGATLHTSMGDIVVDLDEQGAPKTVNNFVFLAEQGFYTNVPFHRVIKGFMIQTGDPTGTGAGGPGYRFADEPITKDYTKGTLAMANAGPNTNGSQFFICQVDNTNKLQKNYTIFGNVVSGQDVVDAIANAPVKASRQGEMSSPVDPITLLSVDISTK